MKDDIADLEDSDEDEVGEECEAQNVRPEKVFWDGDDDPNPKRQRLMAAVEKRWKSECQKPSIKEIIRQLEKEPQLVSKPMPERRENRRLAKLHRERAEGSPLRSEVYSPPRMTKFAEAAGLPAGLALDLTTAGPDDGQPWNFERQDKRIKAMKKLREQKPALLIACPMCQAFCSVQAINYAGKTEAEVAQLMRGAMAHLRFAIDLCRMQYMEGRFLL